MSAPRENEEQPASRLRIAVRNARATTGLMDALVDLYEQFGSEPRPARATCRECGECCRFDLAGHRLYASTAELALLSGCAPVDPAQALRGRCPYQVGPRCSARSVRPLGCRVFFCDTSTSDWCARIYEKYHRRIRLLHESFHVPYRYVELTSALAEIPAGRGALRDS